MPSPLVESFLKELRTDSLSSASRFAGRRVHFIGIGGSGMSGLARMLLDCGAIVTGSEPKPNGTTFELARAGAKISRDQLGELLGKDVDLVVRTAAVPDSNPEFQAAKARGLPTVKYAELLGQVMAERFGVAVAGTHGKSTTSAMIGYALTRCGADPSFVIGGTVPQLGGGGSHSGRGAAFVAEACEFDRSFHNLRPRVALILNIEEDHLDCYKDLGQIIESFRVFAQRVPKDGLIVANAQDANVAQALRGIAAPIQTVSLDGEGVWNARQTGVESGCCIGEISFAGKKAGSVRLSVPGQHNLFNATMAVAACAACGVDPARAAEAIGGFAGVDRRMSVIGRISRSSPSPLEGEGWGERYTPSAERRVLSAELNSHSALSTQHSALPPSTPHPNPLPQGEREPSGGALVVDDYGHHPTEIRATLSAARQRWQPRRLFCVFQPHQHSRTRFLLEDFARSFALADETIVPDIYFVRDSEAERQRISAIDLVERIGQNGQRARHLPDFASIVAHLRREAGPGDLILTMGAGNVWEIGRELVEGK